MLRYIMKFKKRKICRLKYNYTRCVILKVWNIITMKGPCIIFGGLVRKPKTFGYNTFINAEDCEN